MKKTKTKLNRKGKDTLINHLAKINQVTSDQWIVRWVKNIKKQQRKKKFFCDTSRHAKGLSCYLPLLLCPVNSFLYIFFSFYFFLQIRSFRQKCKQWNKKEKLRLKPSGHRNSWRWINFCEKKRRRRRKVFSFCTNIYTQHKTGILIPFFNTQFNNILFLTYFSNRSSCRSDFQ